jgi:signal transduction histidine kinase
VAAVSAPAAGPAPRRRWRDLPWATQLAVLLALLAVAPLTLMTLYNHAAARRELVAATRAQSVQRARATAAALDSELARALADVGFLAVDGATVRFLAGDRDLAPARGEVRTTLRQLRAIHHFDALYLTDRAGRVVAASDDRLLGRSYLAAPHYLTAIAGTPAVHEPHWDPLDRRVFLHVSAPVRRPDGGLVGAAVGRFGLRRLDRLIAADSNYAGRDAYGVLWDAHGIRLSHPTAPALTFRPLAPLQPQLVERLAAEERFGPATRRLLTAASGAHELVELSGWLLYDRSRPAHAWLDREAAGAGPPGPVLAAVAPLRGERWLYGIFTPEASILASLRRETGRALLFAGGTAIAAVLLALWTAGRMAEPLRRMGRAANALARGDMTRRVRLDRGDELGETATAFDAMADALAATEAALRAHAGELERRVEERTAALAASEAELRATVGREQEARRRAEEANRLKDEFLSTVSHELRTPLNAILGWAYVLQTGSLDDEAAARALASIERNARAQSQIVDDLLDVSRIITGKLRLKLVPVDLEQVVGAALESVRPAADAKGIDLRLALEAPAEKIAGDAGRLQQVVWNLLANAVKFTPAGGRVEVAVESAPDEVALVVRDTGAGIHRDFLPYVFDRFRQADSTATRVHGGLGLGLAIVRHLVELHGGTVTAESAGEGQGATFKVTLPRRAALPEAAAEAGEGRAAAAAFDAAPSPLAGVRVLVVDDERDARELLPTLLEPHGARVTVAASAAEALAALATEWADVLVADLGMPEEDGYSLIRRVRGLDGGAELPAIALTAYAGEGHRRRALEAGFQVHLAKPVEPSELLAAVLGLAGAF